MALSYLPSSLRASPIFLWAMAIPIVSFILLQMSRSSYKVLTLLLTSNQNFFSNESSVQLPHVQELHLHIFLAVETVHREHYSN